MTGGTVRAAGGVVWRRRDDGTLEVVLVHRPRYDDWSFPKGKCDHSEPDLDCALREVEEETGVLCRAGDELVTVAYEDGKGRPKVVRYWAMTVSEDRGFTPNDEVDAIEWLSVGKARARLSYAHDVSVLDQLT